MARTEGEPPHPSALSIIPSRGKIVPLVVRRNISGSSVVFVGADRRDEDSYPAIIVDQVVKTTDITILDYYSYELENTLSQIPELTRLAAERLFNNYVPVSSNSLVLDPARDSAERNHKDIVVLDPDNNPQFFIWSHAFSPLEVAFGISGLGIYASDRSTDARSMKATRRHFLAMLGGTIMLSAGSLGNLTLSTADMRMVTVAQGLVQYCSENPPQRLAVIYPPAEITNGLLYYLDHSRDRSLRYQIYSTIPGLTRAIRHFESARGYRWRSELIR